MNTGETYVSNEIAQLLNKLGFDLKCYYYYINDDPKLHTGTLYVSEDTKIYPAPTLAVAQSWLIEEKGCCVWVEPCKITYPETSMAFNNINTNEWTVYIWINEDNHFVGTDISYKHALGYGIYTGLTLLLNCNK